MMRRFGMGMAAGAIALAFAGPAAVAQELNEVCPDSPDMTGALWGLVADEDAQMGMPGATVVVTWEKNGEAGQADGQTGLDGSYTICYVPMEVGLSVRATLANLAGSAVTANLTEQITRVDLGLSLTGTPGGGGADERVWACFGGTEDNQINIQNSRILRCDPGWQGIGRCPKAAEHGQVQATISGGSIAADDEERDERLAGSSDFREALEKIVADGQRLGGNALINWRLNRNSLTAEAVTITVDPATCT